MAINTENNKKTEAIKESLAEFLNQLKWEENKFNEIVEFAGNGFPLPFYFDIGSLNKGINILEKFEFQSVDDLDSVKRLRETELFFLKTDALNKFKFPDYQSNISPSFLIYGDIETQLDALFKKADNLIFRGYHSESIVTKDLTFHLRNLNRWYFKEKIVNYEDYKTRALGIIANARPLLEQHRGYKRLLGNLILLIVTLGTTFIVNKAVNGHFLFFQKTDSAEKLDQLEQPIHRIHS